MSLKIVRAWAWGDRIPDCSAKMHERILISRGGSSSNQFKTKSVLKSLQFDSKLCTMYKKYRLCLLALETKMLKGNQLYLQIDPITLKRKNLISWLRMDMFNGPKECRLSFVSDRMYSVVSTFLIHYEKLEAILNRQPQVTLEIQRIGLLYPSDQFWVVHWGHQDYFA